MGNKTKLKLFVLTVLFLCACVAVYARDTREPNRAKPLLRDVFQNIEGYKLLRNIELSDNATKMLNLDDYLYADFLGKSGRVNLYIGYYYSADKAYAPHSPTVCYPSQGWKINTEPVSGKFQIGSNVINYQEIITSFGQQKELVLYWYQARLHTNTKVYSNKIDLGYNKIVHKDDQHGFVRVAVPVVETSYAKTKKAALYFINSFYPQFVKSRLTHTKTSKTIL